MNQSVLSRSLFYLEPVQCLYLSLMQDMSDSTAETLTASCFNHHHHLERYVPVTLLPTESEASRRTTWSVRRYFLPRQNRVTVPPTSSRHLQHARDLSPTVRLTVTLMVDSRPVQLRNSAAPSMTFENTGEQKI